MPIQNGFVKNRTRVCTYSRLGLHTGHGKVTHLVAMDNASVPRQVRWLELNVDRIMIDSGSLHRDWVNTGMCDNDI